MKIGLLSFFLSFFLLAPSSTRADLQVGDLIFLSLPCYWCELIEKTTESQFNHVAVVTGRSGKDSKTGEWLVTMAVEPKVIETPLAPFLKISKIPAVIMRLDSPQSVRLGAKVAQHAREFLGDPYDHDFRWGAPSYYCAEFISLVFFLSFDKKINLFPPRPMDFRSFWKEWTKYFGRTPPQGVLGLSPADILSSRFLVKVQY